MKKILISVLLTIAVFPLACSKGTDNNGTDKTFQETWFPMEVGMRWTYVGGYPFDTSTTTAIAETTINSVNGVICLSSSRHDSIKGISYLFADQDSAWSIGYYHTLNTFLRFPFVEGDWVLLGVDKLNIDEYGDTVDGDFYYYIAYQDSVTVPAGTFDPCWRIEDTYVYYSYHGTADTSLERTRWYGEDAGIIKMSYPYEVNIKELLSFETNVDVDTLWPLPEDTTRARPRKFDIMGRIIR